MQPHRRALTALGITAGAVTIALTGAAFWLSYEHLHDIAGSHLLDGSRAWVWPGTVDAFIAVGELLTLRASLQNRIDWWAIALAAFGSGGSIALNIFGVGASASPLDYTVAAVPPTAALVAFGALMRQVHDALDRIQDATASDDPAAFEQAASEATALATPASVAAVSAEVSPDAHTADAAASERAVPAPTASDSELIEQARALAEHGPMSLRRMQRELGIGQARATRIRDALDKEAS